MNIKLDDLVMFSLMQGIHGEDMRVEPVGQDSEESTYWNFNDERLYKETKPPEPPREKQK